MKLYSKTDRYTLYNDNMLNMLQDIEENSIDAIVTDPPYELGFMGKEWDRSGVAFQRSTWEKCLRVLKPGGYLLAFAGSRTYHRIVCAIEDAGFEIRDCILYLYGSGFPKSMSVSKGIEARELLGNAGTRNKRIIEQSCDSPSYTIKQPNNGVLGDIVEATRKEYTPQTELAKQWDGWGTCLKPAYEPIVIARKPFQGSLIDNILNYGVGALNIDGCRVGDDYIDGGTMPDFKDVGHKNKELGGINKVGKTNVENAKRCDYDGHFGRFPANVIHDGSDEVCDGFPESKGASSQNNYSNGHIYRGQSLHESQTTLSGFRDWYNDDGSASRYFYCAKASKRDRDEGLENSGGKNTHPTVKNTELMSYLIRLVCPKGATILDPFMGSGSTGKAAMYENTDRNANYKFIGIELTDEYLPIAKARIDYAIGDDTIVEYDGEQTVQKVKQNIHKKLW